MRRRTSIGRAGHIKARMAVKCGGAVAENTRTTQVANMPSMSSKSRRRIINTLIWQVIP
jgi:hypothetical protein